MGFGLYEMICLLIGIFHMNTLNNFRNMYDQVTNTTPFQHIGLILVFYINLDDITQLYFSFYFNSRLKLPHLHKGLFLFLFFVAVHFVCVMPKSIDEQPSPDGISQVVCVCGVCAILLLFWTCLTAPLETSPV